MPFQLQISPFLKLSIISHFTFQNQPSSPYPQNASRRTKYASAKKGAGQVRIQVEQDKAQPALRPDRFFLSSRSDGDTGKLS